MPYVKVGSENSGDIELYYEDHGSGKPVVLIHGYPLSGASWEKQIPVLLNGGHRVITYDRRGFGKSSQPTTGFNYDTFAEDLHKLIAHLNLQDLALVGFSMGGGEIARYLGKYGSKGISKAVIIGGVPPFLLKTEDNQEGVDARVFEGIQRAITADRYVFFSEFLKTSTTPMCFWASALVRRLCKPVGTSPRAHRRRRAWHLFLPGMKTSGRTWLAWMFRRW